LARVGAEYVERTENPDASIHVIRYKLYEILYELRIKRKAIGIFLHGLVFAEPWLEIIDQRRGK
jgi:hypothetical protein